MPLNIPGLLVPFQLLFNPRLVLPAVTIRDIRQLDFSALHKAGYRGAVFDKDNCLTFPYKDTLVPELQDAWRQCRETFGEGNVLIVSNSAGTPLDSGQIQAESVSYHLSVPVLRHISFKPAYSCIKNIQNYFSSLPVPIRDDQLFIVGDRVFTDVVLGNRMWKKLDGGTKKGPLTIWTTGVWKKESMVMRWGEHKLIDLVRKWTLVVSDVELRARIVWPEVEGKMIPRKKATETIWEGLT